MHPWSSRILGTTTAPQDVLVRPLFSTRNCTPKVSAGTRISRYLSAPGLGKVQQRSRRRLWASSPRPVVEAVRDMRRRAKKNRETSNKLTCMTQLNRLSSCNKRKQCSLFKMRITLRHGKDGGRGAELKADCTCSMNWPLWRPLSSVDMKLPQRNRWKNRQLSVCWGLYLIILLRNYRLRGESKSGSVYTGRRS